SCASWAAAAGPAIVSSPFLNSCVAMRIVAARSRLYPMRPGMETRGITRPACSPEPARCGAPSLSRAARYSCRRRDIWSTRRRSCRPGAVMQLLRQMLDESDWWPGLDADQQQRVHAAIVVRDIDAGGIFSARGGLVAGWLGVVDGLVKIPIDAPDGR